MSFELGSSGVVLTSSLSMRELARFFGAEIQGC